MRFLVGLLLCIVKDMTAFLVMGFVYIFTFSVSLYQTRQTMKAQASAEDSEYHFGLEVRQMYELFLGSWESANYSQSTVYLFVLVTLLLNLVLLNMIIACLLYTSPSPRDS
eukprot:TRINITY_DN15715_c0_g2_i1.p1 TRINITY_DN15715_c0_g2~~TRINITY_DN15715_c0_g2_i1.p1  ORF type:complete len:111 (+),score=5.28 TRINITY_DN15715_c0_g2_i1:125-457(+)